VLLPWRTECAETLLRLETWVVDEGSPTFPAIAALMSPTKSTPSELRRIRRWMIFRICMKDVFAAYEAEQTPMATRVTHPTTTVFEEFA
jgi:hypothetical protein